MAYRDGYNGGVGGNLIAIGIAFWAGTAIAVWDMSWPIEFAKILWEIFSNA